MSRISVTTMIDAKHVRVNCSIPGLTIAGCDDLCSVLIELGRLITENSGAGAPLTVTLHPIDRSAPLGNIVTTTTACAPITEYHWTIQNLATNTVYTFAGLPQADATAEPHVVSGTYSLPLIDWNSVGGQLCNYRVTLTVTDNCHRYATEVKLSLLPVGSLYRQAFTYTGSDQDITVPPCATKALVKAWGAGGSAQSYLPTHGGGAGGYTEASIPVTPGDLLTVIVGQSPTSATAYGFAGSTGDGTGGGLSGLFTGHTKVLHAENSRALLIAGGGGGGDYAGNNASRGGNGNDPDHSGGQNTMQGIADNLDNSLAISAATYCGSGGGGYHGGGRHYRTSVQGSATTLPYGGEGGSPFVVSGATGIKILATPDGSNVAPNSTDPDYQTGIAVGAPPGVRNGVGGHGLVVIYWMTA